MSTDKSLEELLSIVNTALSSKEDFAVLKEDKSNLNDFIREYQIKDGGTAVPNYKIYHEYKAVWRPQGTKLSKVEFFRRFNKVFKAKRKSTARCYLLDSECFDISKESLDAAKKYDRNVAVRKKNKALKQTELQNDEKDMEGPQKG